VGPAALPAAAFAQAGVQPVGPQRTPLGLPLVTATPRRQPNVLLVTIDTLRYDHVGPGGALHVPTPVLDRLAAQGACGAAYVQLPQTLPNHATILTGTYVQTHGLRTTLLDNARPEVPTLDQLFRAAGYRTGAIVSWYSFDQEFTNLVRAWDTFEQVVVRFGTSERVSPEQARELYRSGAEMGHALDGDARVTTDAALRWLDSYARETDRPWFFWLHYRDPHYPYTPPPPYRALPPVAAGSEDGAGAVFDGSHESLGKITAGYRPTPAELARVVAAYDGEIAYTDAQLGRVVQRLDDLGLARDTILVVTGDHGESFLEHGPWDWLHGHSVYEAAVRVPLIIRYPAAPELVVPGTRFRGPVQSADIAPTLLAWCGLPTGAMMEGRSMAALLAGQEEPPPPRAAWGTLFDDSQSYVVAGDWKLVRWNDPGRRVADELYHLASDPRETYDYRAEQPDVAGRLQAALDGWLAAKAAGLLWRPWET
jgi:arylsulfatase A-like enzyme